MDSKRYEDRNRICPKCGRKDNKVVDSRVYSDGYIHRKRVCADCGSSWQSIEVPLKDWGSKYASKIKLWI